VSALSAQTTVVRSDFETWSSVGAEAKLGEKWGVGIEEQLRLKENSAVTDEYFTGISLKYTMIDKKLKFAGGYRFISENNSEENYELEHRLNFDAIYLHSFNRLKLSTRLRYQSRNDIGEKADDGDYSRQYLRLKLKTEYKIKNWKLDPIASVELFRKFEKYTIPYFSDLRIRVGTSYDMKKFGEIQVFYQFNQEFWVSYPQTTYVIGLGYRYKLGNLLNNKD
jgi:hypothetical protein